MRDDGTVGKFGVPSEDDDLSSSQSAGEAADEYDEWRQELLMEENW